MQISGTAKPRWECRARPISWRETVRPSTSFTTRNSVTDNQSRARKGRRNGSVSPGITIGAQVVLLWNEAALQGVRDSKLGPPMVARALANVRDPTGRRSPPTASRADADQHVHSHQLRRIP